MSRIIFSLIVLISCTGCMGEMIAAKYDLGNTTPRVQVQPEFPQSKPYRAYYIGSDIELKMNTDDYVIVRIDSNTFRFVPKTDVENRLRQQMNRPITLKR